MSIHTDRARKLAAEKGGYAACTCALDLWGLSKRELIEVALRLGALVQDDDSPEGGTKAVIKEIRALRDCNII